VIQCLPAGRQGGQTASRKRSDQDVRITHSSRKALKSLIQIPTKQRLRLDVILQQQEKEARKSPFCRAEVAVGDVHRRMYVRLTKNWWMAAIAPFGR
jgi:hypothetical protein